jgi:hypothetical protein
MSYGFYKSSQGHCGRYFLVWDTLVLLVCQVTLG